MSKPIEDVLDVQCESPRRRMYRVFVPLVEGVWAPGVHSNCVHNEWASLALRTMGETPADPSNAWGPGSIIHGLSNGLKTLLKKRQVESWSLERVVASYSGRLRRRYQGAYEELLVDGLDAADCKLRPFLKAEKFNPLAKVSKPRMINPRGPKYNLLLASFLKPLEHCLWKYWKCGHLCPPTRVSGKSLSGLSRAELIQRKWNSVGDCVAVEVDGKAFEAHVTKSQLRCLEHSIYKAVYPGNKTLAGLLGQQLTLEGKSVGGIRFKRPGSRASGDFNTGLGNTILMGMFTIGAMESLRLETPWTVLADGDNCLLFIHRRDHESVIRLFPEALSRLCGHEMTVERPAYSLEEVTFGQCNPVETTDGWRMVRNPYKTLSGAFCGYRHFSDRKFTPRLVRAIAMAELSLNQGVPILQPYFAKVVSLLSGAKNLADPSNFLEGHMLHSSLTTRSRPIDDRARRSFERAYGIGLEEQIRLEEKLSRILDQLPSVLAEGKWLESVVSVRHGKVSDDGFNSGDTCFLESLD